MVVLDTSLAVPLLSHGHPDRPLAARWAVGRALALTNHSLAETYSVLTRLPGDARVSPGDAVRLLDGSFAEVVMLDDATASTVHRVLAAVGISGGAVYDALVALAARAAGLPLATRDARARATYEALGVRVEVVAAG